MVAVELLCEAMRRRLIASFWGGREGFGVSMMRVCDGSRMVVEGCWREANVDFGRASVQWKQGFEALKQLVYG